MKTIPAAATSPATVRAKTRTAIKFGHARAVAQTYLRAIGRHCATIALELVFVKTKQTLIIKIKL